MTNEMTCVRWKNLARDYRTIVRAGSTLSETYAPGTKMALMDCAAEGTCLVPVTITHDHERSNCR